MGRPPKIPSLKAYRSAMRVVFSPEAIEAIDKLSEETGIGVRQVIDDTIIDCIPVMRTDAYQSLVEFRNRRGKIIHERDLQRIDGTGEKSAPEEEEGTIGEIDPIALDSTPGEDGYPLSGELPRRPPATPENLEVFERSDDVMESIDDGLPL